MASSITGTVAARILNEKHDIICSAAEKVGGMRALVESFADLIECGDVEVTGVGLKASKSGVKISPKNKKAVVGTNISTRDFEAVKSENGKLKGQIKELNDLLMEYKKLAEQAVERCDGLSDKEADCEINEGEDKLLASLSRDCLEDLESMAQSDGMTLDELIRDFHGRLEIGEIGLNNGLTVGVVSDCPFDWKIITDAADEMSLDYEAAVKKCAAWIYKGTL